MSSIQPKDNSREIIEAILNDEVICSLKRELSQLYLIHSPVVIIKNDGTIETKWDDEIDHRAKVIKELIAHRVDQIKLPNQQQSRKI